MFVGGVVYGSVNKIMRYLMCIRDNIHFNSSNFYFDLDVEILLVVSGH